MCGIVGAIAQNGINVVPVLMRGLHILEYRGYDSAGIAVLDKNQIHRLRVPGKVAALEAALVAQPIQGAIGVAHTRWATHGVPAERNAHPHVIGDRVVLVHNGIIENHAVLKDRFLAEKQVFSSDTDTEVVGFCILDYLKQGHSLLEAVRATVKNLEGAYALCVMDLQDPEILVGVRSGAPLVVGLGESQQFLASDTLALQDWTDRFIYLAEGDIVALQAHKITCYNVAGVEVQRTIHQKKLQKSARDKGSYRHFMLKEIFEQPEVIRQTFDEYLSVGSLSDQAFGPAAATLFKEVQHIQVIACGTSYYAGMIAGLWLEDIAGIACAVEIASEFRYRKRVLLPNTLLVCISQSGETADTLAALRSTKTEPYIARLSICNVADSSLMRESDLVFLSQAGLEIGVCSTKAFSAQLVALFFLSIVLGRRFSLSPEREHHLLQALTQLPAQMDTCLALGPALQALAPLFAHKSSALFLGRGLGVPMALEGALKLKELSYIHAEAYPAGELKHGPLALVDEQMPVVVLAPSGPLLEKIKSNMQEVQARGGVLIVLGSAQHAVQDTGIHYLALPEVLPELMPLVYSIPLQLLAYYVALLKGTDVDQPRNLAKSVTVE